MINKDIIEQAISGLGVKELTEMQQRCASLSGKDCILLSPTGSGKTLAFLLYLLNSLETKPKGIQAIIISPTRELAIQIDEVMRKITNSWKSCCCYGGHDIQKEKKAILEGQTDVVIGTVGRILDHIEKGNIHTNEIKYLLIDEFDKSLELGFLDDMLNVLSSLSNIKNKLLSSATYSAENTPLFIDVDKAEKIDYSNEVKGNNNRLETYIVESPENDKINTLYQLLCELGKQQSIVFCNHRESVDRVFDLLTQKNIDAVKYHGGMEQLNREKAIYKFRNKSCLTLISTDLAARGLDIPDVENIIHYHIPIDKETYTHRNGRTARWKARGSAYIILNSKDSIEHIDTGEAKKHEISSQTPKPARSEWKTVYIGKGKKDKISKADIAGFLYKKGGLAKEDIGQIEVNQYYTLTAIKSNKIKNMLHLVRGEKIKGVKTIFEEAK